MTPDQLQLSVIVPFYNEEETLVALHDQLTGVLRELGMAGDYELIFVDDGSTDRSAAKVEQLSGQDPAVVLIQLRGNYGKSAALAAGFDHARGRIVITMDADLQDDPEEIGRFLVKLEEGYDLVSGYKQERHDPWHKVYPSRLFNALVRRLTGISLHDVNCGFKCYRRSVIDELLVYGELHRFLPVLAHWRRFRQTEIIVKHHPRRFGTSKFGVTRMYRGFMDLITVAFLMRYGKSPSHLFGKIGLVFGTAGFLICSYLSVQWFRGFRPIGNRPLLLLGVLLIIVGVQFVANGLIAELLTHMSQRSERPYSIARIVHHQEPQEER